MPPLTILSCGIDAPDTTRLSQWGRWADCVYGSSKLLALDPEFEPKGIRIGADARQKAQEAIEASRAGKNILLLASGDALFHGIGGTVRSLATDKDELLCLPAETAFQTLFHRLGLPWENAALFSVHFTKEPQLAEILSCPLAIVYAGSRFTASTLAGMCAGRLPSCADRAAVIAENLGTPEERIMTGTLSELAQGDSSPTSILLLLPPERADQSPTLPLGQDNSLYAKENNLITGEEVRAIILSKLRLPAWGTLWDIGAGSGSVGLEAAGLRPGLQVHGLEKNEARLAMILQNRKNLSRPNYTLHAGSAPNALKNMPTPDRVFIGGGGQELDSLLETAFHALTPGGLLVASSVTIESAQILRNWHPENRTGYWEIDIAEETLLAGKYHHLKQQNRISLFTFVKP